MAVLLLILPGWNTTRAQDEPDRPITTDAPTPPKKLVKFKALNDTLIYEIVIVFEKENGHRFRGFFRIPHVEYTGDRQQGENLKDWINRKIEADPRQFIRRYRAG